MRGPDGRLHRLFEHQVEQTPDSIALVSRAESLRYRDLNERANRLAHVLLEQGVSRGHAVAIALPRDQHLLVALLAVLKAGGHYVPLDLAYPQARTRFMIDDSGCEVMIGTAAVATELGGSCRAIDPTAGERSAARDANPDIPGALGDLAYIIYTSGSTGRPKGVAIEHRSVQARMAWAKATFSSEELRGMLASTSICFDLSVFEMFAPLCSGGRVILANNALDLAELPARPQVTFINTVPSAMRELLRLDAVPDGAATVCLAGEAFPRDLAQALGSHPAVRRIVNAYGPSEDTTYSTWAEVDPVSEEAPPIGRPLPGTYVRILDENGEPCADGAPGELYLGGVGLARGYVDRDQLTAERFLSDRFSDDPAARMYRTGDRVCRRPDGQLAYLGRADDQIKLRGYRIELGEIERVLGEAPDAGECMAALVDGPAGDPRLAAYYTGDGEAAALRSIAERHLPAYMVPAVFVRLPELPRTLNGKRDRARLPEPTWAAAFAHVSTGAPSLSAREAEIARVWREVLGVANVGRDDDFLELGGHSLLAARIVARLRRETGLELGVSELFADRTVARCADRLARCTSAATSASPSASTARARAPLSATQLPMWAHAQLAPDDTSYNLAYAVRCTGKVDVDRMLRALRRVVARHPALHLRIVTRDGRAEQELVTGVDLAVPVHEQPVAPSQRAAVLAERTRDVAARPFDLGVPPLLRCELVGLGDGEWGIALAVHHAIFDAVSLDVLLRDLARLEAMDDADDADRAPSYLDACHAQEHRNTTAELAAWRAELEDVPPVPFLPTDRPRPPSPGTAGTVTTFTLDGEIAHAIAALARREGVTEYMLLLAALQLVLADASGRSTFVTLTAMSGRSEPHADGAIGCFINMVPVRGEVRAGEPFIDHLHRVRERALAALDREATPLFRILDELAAPRAQLLQAFGQIAFGVLPYTRATASNDRITLEAVELRAEQARLELSVWATRRDNVIDVEWTYRTDLFEPATIAGLHDRLAATLRRVTAPPARRSLAGRPKPRQVGSGDLATLERGALGASLPTLIRARLDGAQLADWGGTHRELIARELSTAGGVLLRGFQVDGTGAFRAFLQAISNDLIRYGERSSPRTELADGVYTSTDHPADQPIVLHNEQSYTLRWPMRIAFFCARPATANGRTPLADSRRVLARMSPATVDRFERLGVLYVRNYHDGISLPWSVAFQTEDRAQVEAYCAAAAVDAEWLDGGRLRTRQVRPAVRTHPVTGERTWFNHALFFHVTSLPGDVSRSLRAAFAEDQQPYNTFYGDGTPIEDAVLAELRQAYAAELVSFPWMRGDVLVLDNMLVAHGREPYVGPREIQTIMADPYSGAGGPP